MSTKSLLRQDLDLHEHSSDDHIADVENANDLLFAPDDLNFTADDNRFGLIQQILDERDDQYIVVDVKGRVLFRNKKASMNSASSEYALTRQHSKTNSAPGALHDVHDISGERPSDINEQEEYANIIKPVLGDVCKGATRIDRFWRHQFFYGDKRKSKRYIERKAIPLILGGFIQGAIFRLRDLTELTGQQDTSLENESRFKRFSEAAADWFWEINEKFEITYLSTEYTEEVAQDAGRLIGQPFELTYSSHIEDKEHLDKVTDAFANHRAFDQVNFTFHINNQEQKHYCVSGVPYTDKDGNLLGYVGAARNTTEAHRTTTRLKYHASHDELTGLLNRREFENHLSLALCGAQEHGQQNLFAFFDLDQFKVVNDTQGHLAGDQLLKLVASQLDNSLRDSDALARFGGDEFGLLMHNCDINDGRTRLENTIKDLNNYRFRINKTQFDISASVGLVEITDDCADISEVLRRADVACYAAKDLGRNQVQVYDADNEETIRRGDELHVASGISNAIENDRLVLYVQPIARISEGSMTVQHHEVLVRMLDDNDNLVPPAAFIPAAERYRLMDKIDRWVIQNAIKNYSCVFGDQTDAQLTINLSGNSMTDQSLVEYVKENLQTHNVPASALCFEITETALVSNLKVAQKLTESLRNIGCSFALDDFGSGMSSFAYLKNFSLDYLKIDGAFVRDIATAPNDKVMVSAINEMAHVMGMKTIAEFVESEEISKILRELNIDYQQGYWIGKPRPML